MSSRQHIGFRFNVLFIVLFIVTIPFPYHIIPDTGGYIAPCFTTVTRYLGGLFPGLGTSPLYDITSDSTGMYIYVLLLVFICFIIAALWNLVNPLVSSIHKYRLTVIASYYLSLQLMIYGFDKAFKHQFYLPEPNTLYTPLGHLSKDILYWSTVGSSYSYTVMSGALELAAAVFLLCKRTRSLAALLSMGILFHVAMINFGFDISVKLYTCFLLYISIVISTPAIKKAFVLFILKKPVAPEIQETVMREGYTRVGYFIFKGVVIGCMLWESLYIHIKAADYNDDNAARPFLHGAYLVKYYIKNGDTMAPVLTNEEYTKRIFIHRQGYFITQLMNDDMQDYKMKYDTTHQSLILSLTNAPDLVVKYTYAPKDSLLILKTGTIQDSITIVAKPINLKQLPLLQPYFHWTSDEY